MQKSGFVTRETWKSVRRHRFIFIRLPRTLGGTTALQNPIRQWVLRNNCQEIIIMKFISILTVFPMLSLLTMMRLGDSHLHVVFCVLLAALEIAQKFKCQTVLLELMFTFYHAHISTSPAFESFAKAEGIYSYLFFIIRIPTVSWKGRVRALSSQILISWESRKATG